MTGKDYISENGSRVLTKARARVFAYEIGLGRRYVVAELLSFGQSAYESYRGPVHVS